MAQELGCRLSESSTDLAAGYISGVLAMDYFISLFTCLLVPGKGASTAEIAAFVIPTPHKPLIVSILSAGTFFGAIIAEILQIGLAEEPRLLLVALFTP